VKEIRRVLKPGGKAFIETPNLMGAGFHYWDDPTHRTVFTKTMAEKLFNDFSEVTVVEERYVPKVKGFFNAARIPFAYRLIARAVPEGLMKPTNRLYCKLIK
jgi:ubiquinone/menaquinone biosynthesis C-methylase UbiE